MAKLAAILVSLILLAVCGWVGWGEYTSATVAGYTDVSRAPVGASGFVSYVTGFPVATATPVLSENEAQNNVRIAVAASLAASFALVYVAFIGAGAIFSVGLTAFIAALTAFGHAILATTLATRIGWAMFASDSPLDYDMTVAGIALYAVLSIVTAFVLLMRLKSVVRGEHGAMVAAVKSLIVLAIAALAFAPVAVPPEFVFNEIHGLFWLSGLCLFTLIVFGLTQSNYRYD